MVDWLIEHRRSNLWASMGIGKSSATLMALDVLTLMGEIDSSEPTLVIGPKRVARDVWPEEVCKWENFRGIQVVPIMGSPRQRQDALKRRAEIYTTNYEQLPWLVEQYLERWPFRQVVADESDRLKGFRTKQGGERARAIGRVAHYLTRRWINLTGTPASNGLKDLWGQNWYVDRGVRLGATYEDFKKRWFHRAWSGFGIEPMPFAEDQIKSRLKDVTLTVDAKDYFDLKEPIVEVIKVRLPPKARRIYRDLEDELYAELGDGATVEVFNAAALTSKCLQLANGAIYTERPKWEAIHDEKLEALESVVAESGGAPVLVAYQFKSDLARLKAAFPRAVELSTREGMKAFREGHAEIGLAHPKSMGHGIDGLQYVCNILVRFGHDWNLGERLQMLERIGPMRQLQAGLDRPVFVYDLIAEKTVDEQVLEVHRTKRRVLDVLLEAMKQR
ncbi:MAG: DEAD/DEAH box helicase [Patescibacteria group bacterium]|nr:DEAD/DEAH box helicase [Patescibacteria group bacterium]